MDLKGNSDACLDCFKEEETVCAFKHVRVGIFLRSQICLCTFAESNKGLRASDNWMLSLEVSLTCR